MHYSQPLVAATLWLACCSSQASSTQDTCDDLFKQANVSASGTVSLEEYRKMQLQERFNRDDTDGNGSLTIVEVAARRASDTGYKSEHADALNAQVIKIDQNMDGYLQASEYAELMAEGTVYGRPPDFSEVARSGRIDYCQLSTRLALHQGRQNFAARDTDNDNSISFKEYVTQADISSPIMRQQGTADGAITLKDCLERETSQDSP
jgi:Ca2+-binding EF-hand superfamily protein